MDESRVLAHPKLTIYHTQAGGLTNTVHIPANHLPPSHVRTKQDDQRSSQMRRAERYRQETKALYKKYECSLMMNAALPLVQLPLFIGFFLGLRRMPSVVPEFATGGTLWFQVKQE